MMAIEIMIIILSGRRKNLLEAQNNENPKQKICGFCAKILINVSVGSMLLL